jgi:hypothetical protein
MRRKTAIAVFGVMFVASLSAVVMPHIIHARDTASASGCVNNLRQMDGAKQQWAMEYHRTINDVPSWKDIRPYFVRGKDPNSDPVKCPAGGNYSIRRVGDVPTCSIGGQNHSLDDDSSDWNRYDRFAELCCVLAFLGLLVAILLPIGAKDSPS